MLPFFEDVAHGANLLALISPGLACNIKQSRCPEEFCMVERVADFLGM